MKKITLLVLGLLISSIGFGQQILSHSTDNMTINSGGVACAGGDPATTADNVFSRSYIPSDFGFTGEFLVMGARFAPVFTDVSGGADAEYIVRLSSTDAAYPTGTLTLLGETTITVAVADDGIFQEVMLDAPVTVDAGTEIVVEIDIADNVDPELFDARIAVNDLGEGAPSYIFSVACSLTSPTTFADINFPNNHIILDLIGDENLSVGDDATLANNVSVFPNPTNGDLNISFARNFGATNIDIINVNGQKVMNASVDGIGNNTLATSRLANGIYFAQVTNETGVATIKFIKN
ncbi:T9SS type A sorting domain-containing protein [Dokdonia ponticola]|uniref:T9SS type A sorting domain-containing protein n=1 Tax=Dokdonia ponticola TaxID=2041041 RepID=A0ABV9HY91_9FLAO